MSLACSHSATTPLVLLKMEILILAVRIKFLPYRCLTSWHINILTGAAFISRTHRLVELMDELRFVLLEFLVDLSLESMLRLTLNDTSPGAMHDNISSITEQLRIPFLVAT